MTPSKQTEKQIFSGTKPLLRVLQGERLARPPFWLMRQAGRYLPEYRELRSKARDFLDLCFRPDMAAEVTLQPLRRFGMDAAIIFSDILVVPYALGQKVEFQEGRGPVLEPISNIDDLPSFDEEKFHQKLSPVYETVNRVRDSLDDKTALIGFAGSPWTVATYMVEGGTSRDFAKIKTWAYSDPDGFQKLIDLLVDSTTQYLSAQIDHGAEVIQLFDSWAGVLSEPLFRRFVLAPNREIIRRLREKTTAVPIIAFPRGAGTLYPTFARECGAQAIGLDTTVPTAWAAAEIQKICPVQGNLDPIALVAGGDMMRRELDKILENLSNGPHIFNLGHGIVPQTPIEHVEELVRILRGD